MRQGHEGKWQDRRARLGGTVTREHCHLCTGNPSPGQRCLPSLAAYWSFSTQTSGSGPTYPKIFLKEDFGGVEGANGVDIYHCLEGVKGQGAGWAQEVPRST